MAVMILDVPEFAWNSVALAVALHGLQQVPDSPQRESRLTRVEIEGTLTKLQQVLLASGAGSRLVAVPDIMPNELYREPK